VIVAGTAERKSIAASGQLKKLMGGYYTELMGEGASDKKTAWCTSVGPAELLLSFGFNVYYPENHGAMLGATRMAADLIPVANARGFAPDICSYLTSDIGSYLKGESPFQKFKLPGPPKADVLVYNTNQCRDVKDWFGFYAQEWNVPCVGVHTPRAMGEIDELMVKELARQTEALIEPLERVSGQAFDIDKLREIVRLSKECTDLWKAVLDTAAAVPAPLTFFDATVQMGPAVVLRGTQEAVDYYKLLLAELQQRVADGVAAIEGEQHRIYWEGMPIWGKLRDLSTLFTEQRTCVAASTYCNSWIFEDLDPEKPFEGMARAYSELFICRGDEPKEAYLAEMIDRYKIDGVLYHDAKTCPNNSNSRYLMPQRLQATTGKPYVIINGDLNDLRLYSEEQTRTNIEALIEQLSEG